MKGVLEWSKIVGYNSKVSKIQNSPLLYKYQKDIYMNKIKLKVTIKWLSQATLTCLHTFKSIKYKVTVKNFQFTFYGENPNIDKSKALDLFHFHYSHIRKKKKFNLELTSKFFRMFSLLFLQLLMMISNLFLYFVFQLESNSLAQLL